MVEIPHGNTAEIRVQWSDKPLGSRNAHYLKWTLSNGAYLATRTYFLKLESFMCRRQQAIRSFILFMFRSSVGGQYGSDTLFFGKEG